MKQQSRTTISFELQIRFAVEGEFVVATARTIDVSSFGSTRAEARAMIQDAVILYLSDLADQGALLEVFKSLGVRYTVETDAVPAEAPNFTVPVEEERSKVFGSGFAPVPAFA